MKYRDVYKKMCSLAAEHLYSLEVYDEFDPEDSEKVDRALDEIQRQLQQKAEQKTRLTKAEYAEIDTRTERLQEQLNQRMEQEFGYSWALLKSSFTKERLNEIWKELAEIPSEDKA